MPEKITDSGLGATACASDSQKCSGTIRALDQQRARNQAKRRGHQRRVRIEPHKGFQCTEIQCAGGQIQKPDPAQHHVAADAVRNGERQRPFQRGFIQVVCRQRKGGDAHHLEPHEQVEQVMGEREPDHRAEEHQHHGVEPRADLLKNPQAKTKSAVTSNAANTPTSALP